MTLIQKESHERSSSPQQRPFRHPLQETVQKIRQTNAYLKVEFGHPTNGRGLAPAELFDATSAHLDHVVTLTQQLLGTKSANVIGSYILQGYQWPFIGTAVAAYLLDQRVPSLSPNDLLVKLSNTGQIESIALTSGRFTALVNDAAAGHPAARTVSHKDALRAVLRTEIETHLRPVIDHLCQHIGCKPRGLWLAAADRCVSTVTWLMQTITPAVTHSRITPEIDGLVHCSSSPLYSPKAGLVSELADLSCHRVTCCHWHRTAEGGYCANCPRQPTKIIP